MNAAAVISPETQKLLDIFLSGYTCDRPRNKQLVWEDERYILLRHRAHSTWVNRMVGQRCCETYVELYSKLELLASKPCRGRRPVAIAKWDGRWNKAKMAEAMKCVESDLDHIADMKQASQ